jgi:hypothetical protein
VSLSNHERLPFDKLRANGTYSKKLIKLPFAVYFRRKDGFSLCYLLKAGKQLSGIKVFQQITGAPFFMA